MNVLVLDLTHGGGALALEYLSLGCAVTAVDIYHTSAALLKELREKGVRGLDASPAEEFDLAVVPVHAPASYLSPARARRTITHHQAVGELARFPFPTVEVTGCRGKTSTAEVLSSLLANEGLGVLSSTSAGRASWERGRRVLMERTSIAPATLIGAARAPGSHDIGVLEVSLGGTGLARVGVVTGLQDDYPIAQGTRRAFDGKAQMIALAKDQVVFLEHERALWHPLVPPGVGVTTFGPGGDVEAVVAPGDLGRPAMVTVRSGTALRTVPLKGGYVAATYSLAFSAALAALRALGMDPLRAAEGLPAFEGVPGRGQVVEDGSTALVRERSPGVSAPSLAFLMRTLVDAYGRRDIGLVLDPVDRNVCERLDLERVREVCDLIPEVRGRYVLPTGAGTPGFRSVEGAAEVMGRHGTVVWATKEGYL
ncbi:MAG TPA: hypothetical protein PKO24_04465 [Methanomassiliicoccales archaeon]|nr:hypothetical protein [Methanomassiliicoccales archaeon]